MLEKTIWQQRLDAIVSGEIEKPEVVKLMRLPDLDEWSSGRVKTHWNVETDFFTAGGSLFGGYIACLADQVLFHATFTILDADAFCRTINLDVEFFLPIKMGVVDIIGTVVHQSKTRIHCQASFEQNGRLMAQAKGIQQIVK